MGQSRARGCWSAMCSGILHSFHNLSGLSWKMGAPPPPAGSELKIHHSSNPRAFGPSHFCFQFLESSRDESLEHAGQASYH